MHFDFETLPPRDRYKLLVSVVVPRPIALVTSVDGAGHVNAAPFSFFNVLGSDPPIVVIAPGDRSPGDAKDTARNICESGDFVVNLVDEEMAGPMNICAIDFPSGMSELAAAGFTPLSSIGVRSPRIAESPISLECRQHTTLQIGRNRVVIAEVLHLHIRDDLIDVEKMYVHTHRLRAIGRMHGGGWYAKTSDLFEIPRLTYDQWQEEQNNVG